MNPKKHMFRLFFSLTFCPNMIPAFCCKYSFLRDKQWGSLYMNWYFILHVWFLNIKIGGFLTALIFLAQGTTKGVSSHHCDGLQRRKPAQFNFDVPKLLIANSYPPWGQHSIENRWLEYDRFLSHRIHVRIFTYIGKYKYQAHGSYGFWDAFRFNLQGAPMAVAAAWLQVQSPR